MARWLAMTVLALGLAAVPAHAQVFKPRDGAKTTDKSSDKSSDKSDSGKKVAAKKPDSAHAAPKHARHPAHHGNDDPDFVKITDDDD